MREIQINLGSKHPINPKEYVNTQTDTHTHTYIIFTYVHTHRWREILGIRRE